MVFGAKFWVPFQILVVVLRICFTDSTNGIHHHEKPLPGEFLQKKLVHRTAAKSKVISYKSLRLRNPWQSMISTHLSFCHSLSGIDTFANLRIAGWWLVSNIFSFFNLSWQKMFALLTSSHIFQMGGKKTHQLHPGRLTWNLQITHLERKMIFQTSMIMFHVNLPGCR